MTFNGSPTPRHACDFPVDTAAEQVRPTAPHAVRGMCFGAHGGAGRAVLSARQAAALPTERGSARAGKPDPGPGGIRALAAARCHPQEHSPQSHSSACRRQALPRVAAPVRRPRPKLGNQTQAGSTDGRVAMGGIIIDRTARLSAPTGRRTDLIEASKALIAGLDLLARQRFVAVEFVGDDRKSIEMFGRLSRRPRLTSRDSSDLRLGLPLYRWCTSASGPRVYLLRRLARKGEVRGTFVGEVSPEYLWGPVDQSMPSPNTRVAVLDELGRSCSAPPKRAGGTTQAQANDTWVDTSVARTKENYLTAIVRHTARCRVCRPALDRAVQRVQGRSARADGGVHQHLPHRGRAFQPGGAAAQREPDPAQRVARWKSCRRAPSGSRSGISPAG